jgi:hypothetical protein
MRERPGIHGVIENPFRHAHVLDAVRAALLKA